MSADITLWASYGRIYGSVQIRSNDRDAVLAAAEATAREKGVKCLVGPAENDWIGVYPEGNGQDESFGAALASRHCGWVLNLTVHDSDVMTYRLWNDGELVDSYWSCPGYFGESNQAEEEAMCGRPEAFEPLIGEKSKELAEILRRDDDVTFEEERLDRFAKLLGIADAAEAYEYLKEKGADRKRKRTFTEVPLAAAAREKKRRDDERKRADDERRALEKSGLLLLRDERKEPMPYGCAVFNGFVVAWPDHRRGTASIELYQPPWREAAPSRWECPAHITGVVSDAAGRRVAMSAGDRVRVWDWIENDWRIAADVPESDLAIAVAVSADGKRIVHSSRQEIVVTEIDGRTPRLKLSGQEAQNLAFHPSGDWVAVSTTRLGLISLQQRPHWRDILIGGAVSTAPLEAMVQAKFAEIDLEELARKQRAVMKAAESKIRQMIERAGGKMSSAQKEAELKRIESSRPQQEEEMQKWLARMAELKEGRAPAKPPQPKEHVRCVGFSRDGQWFWCGTHVGLRVFRWEDFFRQSGPAGEPVWRFDMPESQSFGGANHVYAIAEEVGAEAIVFGGGDGWLRRFDLLSGEVRELAKLPGAAWVMNLAMSSDGETLGVASRQMSLEQTQIRDGSRAWDVWNYPRLRAANASAT